MAGINDHVPGAGAGVDLSQLKYRQREEAKKLHARIERAMVTPDEVISIENFGSIVQPLENGQKRMMIALPSGRRIQLSFQPQNAEKTAEELLSEAPADGA